MISGNCNCGAVRYAIDADPHEVYVCHCSICRRFTGSGGIAVLVVPKTQFRWLCDTTAICTWKKPDSQWESWFCVHCGSAIPGNNSETTMFVPAGSISSDTSALRVAHHIYVDSKAPWEVIADEGRQHPEAYRA